MPEAVTAHDTEIQTYRQYAGSTRAVVAMNIAGITHEESLIRPEPGGNCLNWVMGHLLWLYNHLLPRLGQEPVMAQDVLERRYARGAPPLTDDSSAIDFGELTAAWEQACDRIDAGIAGLTPEALDAPGVKTGGSEPDPMFRISLTTALFHQAYHSGQTAVLRRLVGKEGAIK